MKIALHQITTRPASMEEDMRAYAEAGWTAFELSLSKARDYIEANSRPAWVDLVRGSSLQAVGCTGHVVNAFGDPEIIATNEAEFDQTTALMAEIECPVIVIGGDGPEEMPAAADNSEAGLSARDQAYRAHLQRFADQLGRLADMAAPRGVTVALEMNWCTLCRSVATAAETLDMVGRDNVGALFDAAHFAVSPSRLSDLDRVSGRIVYGHLDDMRGCPPELMTVNEDRVLPGEGALPLGEWYEKIDACGYRGWHAVELFCNDLWKLPVDEIARRTKDACLRVWPDAQF